MGSFFNVVGLRVPSNQSIMLPGSHCINCKKPIKSFDMIPVLSFSLLKGKCRSCKQKISGLYPLIELFTGVLFLSSYVSFGWSVELIGSLLVISLLMIIFVSDIVYMLIPDKILLFFTPLFIIYRIFVPTAPWWDAWLGAILGFLFLQLIAVVSRGGMGGGDIKLFALLGIMFGWKGILLLLFLSSLFGSIIGVVLLATKKVQRKEFIPFGPFIVIAAIVTLFFGVEIMGWYLL